MQPLEERYQRLLAYLRGFADLVHQRIWEVDREGNWSPLWWDEVAGTQPYAELWRENEPLYLKRPPTGQPFPELPPELKGWILGNLMDPRGEPRHRDSLEGEAFAADPLRPRAWQDWLRRWQTWAALYRAEALYRRLSDLYDLLEREGEAYELLLGNALLSRDGVYYPLLLLPVKLELGAKGAFHLQVLDDPRLEASLLTLDSRVEEQLLKELEDELFKADPLDPFAKKDWAEQLAETLKANFVLGRPRKGPSQPWVGHAPVLFLRRRGQAYGPFIERLQRAKREPSRIFAQILGFPPAPWRETQALDPLFPKPYNREQLKILERLEAQGAVLVQGPPGTGKTHTIANLIAHLMAQGQRVLVVAEKPKALSMVRHHLPESIRPLVISADLEDQTKRQLEEAVQAILAHLNEDPKRLEEEIHSLESERQRIKARVEELKSKRLEALQAEYREISIGGESFRPLEAARLVAEGEKVHSWIPGPVQRDHLPLSVEEVKELYRLNAQLPKSLIEQLHDLPDPTSEILAPLEAAGTILEKLQSPPPDPGPWSRPPQEEEQEAYQRLLQQAPETGQDLQKAEGWSLALLEGASSWKENFLERLQKEAQNLATLAAEKDRLAFQLGYPKLRLPQGSPDSWEKIARRLEARARQSNGAFRPGFLGRLALSAEERLFLDKARIGDRPPQTSEEFRLFYLEATLKRNRRALAERWNGFVRSYGGPSLQEEKVERGVEAWVQHLQKLHEQQKKAREILEELNRLGLNRSLPHTPEAWKELGRFLTQELPSLIPARLEALERLREEKKLEDYLDQVHRWINTKGTASARSAVQPILWALERRDLEGYQKSLAGLKELLRLREAYKRRQSLLDKLRPSAPAWAQALEDRSHPHTGPEPPGDPIPAWRWRRLEEALKERQALSLENIQRQLEEAEEKLRHYTAELVHLRTWLHQIRRVTPEERTALVGWLQTMRRLGKGKGRLAHQHRREARRQLSRAKGAVPVWIMPVARAVEQLDPTEAHFDVVIMDEASQSGPLGLLPLALGDRVVIVGDDRQVSPESVGVEVERFNALIQRHLDGFLHDAKLYDGQSSVYEIADRHFGGRIRLQEHFRCVPEIIQFCNQLAYEGTLLPLRSSEGVALKPHVVPRRVPGRREGKVNQEEALFIVTTIQAMLEHPAYRDKTIGVISLLGREQAELIRRHLEERIPAEERQARRLLVGSPPEFQGDERDVIFLSMVDSPSEEGSPLTLRDEERETWLKRYNVAVSRARDQLWVVYSLDPYLDLKEGDIRRRLLEYALTVYREPKWVYRQLWGEDQATESPFEKEVLRRLTRAGYKVRTQVPVGRYRLDLVVEGDKQRIAIECDGERYHGLDRLEADLERQAILERLGWRFIRIRGSAFYRDPDGTMDWVFRRLISEGITPQATSSEEASPPLSNHPILEEILSKGEALRQGWGLERGRALLPET